MGGNRGVPHGWEDYSKMGIQIENTPFIAFKVPLNPWISSRISEVEERFTLDDLLNKEQRIGLIIDLTYTCRYYDADSLKERNIAYEKIYLEGHGKVPSDKSVQVFTKIVNKFIAKSDKLIGVHCTHGVNRTGFMICKYMIDQLSFKPKDAIEAFEKARGHKIVREAYVETLLSRKPQSSSQSKSRNKFVAKPSRFKREKKHYKQRRNKHSNFQPSSFVPSQSQQAVYNHFNPTSYQPYGGYYGYSDPYQNYRSFQPQMSNFRTFYPSTVTNQREHLYGHQRELFCDYQDFSIQEKWDNKRRDRKY